MSGLISVCGRHAHNVDVKQKTMTASTTTRINNLPRSIQPYPSSLPIPNSVTKFPCLACHQEAKSCMGRDVCYGCAEHGEICMYPAQPPKLIKQHCT
ncbi:hypothetical protein K439DRAFT_977887 [Ramaria rubella]|nr:hypothetical protein K439DRAFT_977887 [Ramaria rubella]